MTEQDNINGVLKKPTHKNFKDLTGQTFGRLFVIQYAGRKSCGASWFCRCECGNIKTVRGTSLRRKEILSCGCLNKEIVKKQFTTHNKSYTKEYKIFTAAKDRCNNPQNKGYYKYGGRGIKFSFETFEDFIKEAGARPTDKHSLDRIQNNGNYEAGNVQWATATKQARNTRNNVFITFQGQSKCISEWSEILGINKNTINFRRRKGFCIECVLKVSIDKVNCVHK